MSSYGQNTYVYHDLPPPLPYQPNEYGRPYLLSNFDYGYNKDSDMNLSSSRMVRKTRPTNMNTETDAITSFDNDFGLSPPDFQVKSPERMESGKGAHRSQIPTRTLPPVLGRPSPWSTLDATHLDYPKELSDRPLHQEPVALRVVPGEYTSSRPSKSRMYTNMYPERITRSKRESTDITSAVLEMTGMTTRDGTDRRIRRDLFESFVIDRHANSKVMRHSEKDQGEKEDKTKLYPGDRTKTQKRGHGVKPQLKYHEQMKEQALADRLRIDGIREAEMVRLARVMGERKAREKEEREKLEDEEWEVLDGPDLSKNYADELVNSDDSETWG